MMAVMLQVATNFIPFNSKAKKGAAVKKRSAAVTPSVEHLNIFLSNAEVNTIERGPHGNGASDV